LHSSRTILRLSVIVVSLVMLTRSLPAQTLVSQNPTDMTAAQTTTVATQTTTSGVTTTTYRSSSMNDSTSGDALHLGTLSTAYTTYTGTAVTGATVIETAGASSVTFSGTPYSYVGATYSAASFWLDSGNLAAPGTVPNADTAGVAFRIGGQNFGGSNFPGTYLVGVDLVKRGDVATNTATNTAGTATIDFYLGVYLDPESATSTTSITGVTAQVFVAGAPTTVSGVTVNGSPNAIYVGQVANANTFGDTQYLTPAGGITPTATVATVASTALTDRTSSLAYLDARNNTNDFITFGGLYTQINSALTAIYGSTGATPNVQWNMGDTVRFVPLSSGGNLATTPARVVTTNGDMMGKTMTSSVTTPFGTNATAAITDAYVTGSNFSLTRVSSDGFTLGVVPEPVTWISSGALLAVGGLLRWRQRWQQGRLAGGVVPLAPAA
jgi:hypothetical protein